MSHEPGDLSPMDRWMAAARELVGKELDRTLRRKNLEASPSLIRRYAFGIGDNNPLWCDPGYARQTRFGRVVAPPTYIFAVDDTVVRDPEMHDMKLLFGGNDIEFFKPIVDGMHLTSKAVVTALREVQSKKAGRLAIMTIDFTYYDTDTGDLLARAITPMMRVPEAASGEGLTFGRQRPHQYTDGEMAQIHRDEDAEVVRGSTPRYWQDVEVGAKITPVVKGPLNLRDMICYYAGNGVAPELYRAHELVRKMGYYVDPMKHLDPNLADEVGMPGPYDIGHQRVGWVSHMLTNWMGDDGFLKRLNVRVSRPNVFGDTTWCRGEVTGKRIEDGALLVDVNVWCENQRGERTADGTATIALPGR